METIKVQKNQIIAKQKEKVKAWYLILVRSYREIPMRGLF